MPTKPLSYLALFAATAALAAAATIDWEKPQASADTPAAATPDSAVAEQEPSTSTAIALPAVTPVDALTADPEATGCCITPSGRAGMFAGAVAGQLGEQPAESVNASSAQPVGETPAGMVWIPGGEFTMGSDHRLARKDERPLHRVRVDGFWIDTTEVTNSQFQAFVEATEYVTTAEREVDWNELKKQLPPGTPKPPEENLQPGSLVFRPTEAKVPLDDIRRWWHWTPGANWRHPEGPGSSIAERMHHPVVHVSWDDAVAYGRWANKRLPTEAEWEFAARGGLVDQPFVWGAAALSDESPQANIWQGEFPYRNTQADGYVRTAPVKSFAANGYGLYDMAGNVWEWTADWYRPDTYALRAGEAVVVNPAGPDSPFDPRRPLMPERVQRGGSFLCNDVYCASYRPAARMPCSPDTGMSHVGFRCVRTPRMEDETQPNSQTGQR